MESFSIKGRDWKENSSVVTGAQDINLTRENINKMIFWVTSSVCMVTHACHTSTHVAEFKTKINKQANKETLTEKPQTYQTPSLWSRYLRENVLSGFLSIIQTHVCAHALTQKIEMYSEEPYYSFKHLTTTFNPAPGKPAPLVDSVSTHPHMHSHPHTDTHIYAYY